MPAFLAAVTTTLTGRFPLLTTVIGWVIVAPGARASMLIADAVGSVEMATLPARTTFSEFWLWLVK